MKSVFTGGATVLGIIAVIIFVLSLTGKKVPFIPNNDKVVMVTIFIIVLTMCALGMTRNIPNINWVSPFYFVAYIFGALALYIFVTVLAGGKVPYLSGYKQATIAIILIMAFKWVLVLVHDKVVK